jgi:DNA-binding MarR family transcriptional regulator
MGDKQGIPNFMVANFPQHASYGFNVRRTHRAFDRLLSAMLSRHGIKTGYWYYLRVLWSKDGLTQREMSTFNNVSENTTAILIGKMMKDRLVTRERDGEDKRKWIVRLTPRSLRLRNELLPYAGQVNEIASRGIPKSELAICLSVLKRMSVNLEQAWHEIDPSAASSESE